MPLTTLPGFTGFTYARMSQFDKRAVGKFTDTNKLHSIHKERPDDYDKQIISLYSQTSLYANDFLNMINKSTPYMLGGSDSWTWKITVPYQFPKIIEVPADTLNNPKVGIDGQEFTLVYDRQEWTQNHIIGAGSSHAPQFTVVKDPTPYNSGFLYTLTLNSESPRTEFVQKRWIGVGVEYVDRGGTIGEFDDHLLGLPGLGEEIQMYETLGSAIGYEHTVTGWAEDKSVGLNNAPRDGQGRIKDILVYGVQRNNEIPTAKNLKWEPFIEFWMRKKMLEAKVQKMIHAKPGAPKTRGSQQEVKKVSAGLLHRIRSNGNYDAFQRGDFSIARVRAMFGAIFYRKVPMGQRRVRMYTNESGFNIFDAAIKKDAFNSGLQFTVADGDRFVQGKGQNLVLNFAFNAFTTRETGMVTISHLAELDLPQTNTEIGQGILSPAIFLIFDVSPDSDGTFGSNIREVRQSGRPAMKWGYIDGRTSHLGSKASVGHTASTMADQYTVWMEDRYDVFIEDLSRCALLEEVTPYFA